jgi:glucokinase
MSLHTDYAIGIDLGGTNVKAVCVAPDGRILSREQFPTDDRAAGWQQAVPHYVHRVTAERGEARAIGVSSPGLARRDESTIAWMRGRMAAVEGFDWTRHLGRHTLVPVLNDAHAALLGEAWVGAARGEQDAALLTLGTGVGGAILCDGRLLRGHLGRAGHLGHLCLDIDGQPDIVNTPGSLEDLIGDHTVAVRSAGRFASTRALVEAVRAGDAAARAVWLRSVQALACAIVSIINAVDPAVIVIGGGIAAAGEALFEPLGQSLDRLEWRPTPEARVRIVPAMLGEFAGAIGAAFRAIQRENEPEGMVRTR